MFSTCTLSCCKYKHYICSDICSDQAPAPAPAPAPAETSTKKSVKKFSALEKGKSVDVAIPDEVLDPLNEKLHQQR